MDVSVKDLEQGMCLVIVEGEAAFTIGCVGSISPFIRALISLRVTWNGIVNCVSTESDLQ